MDQYVDETVSDGVVAVEEIIQRKAHIGNRPGANGALERSGIQFIATQRADADVEVFGDIVFVIEHKRAGEDAVVKKNYQYGGSGDD